MRLLAYSLILGLVLTLGGPARAQSAEASMWQLADASGPGLAVLGERDAAGLPGLRPRLTMSLPLPGQRLAAVSEDSEPTFSWSLEAWQLNTASLAHIQCNRLTSTIDSFLAEDCRFVEDPVPQGSVNLMRVSGQWTAAPGLDLNIGAFSARTDDLRPAPVADSFLLPGSEPMEGLRSGEGLDAGISFGIANERLGDFLIGLQVARYRQRMSLRDLGFGGLDAGSTYAGEIERYANSAQLAVGWRRGRFSGDLLGQARDVPVWLAPGQYGQGVLNSFDLEFSWRAVRNASITIGVSNVLDAAPRNLDEPAIDPGLEDPVDPIYGRIPYVRYKHDL
ncbi:MAG: hypothetical protein ACLFSC_10325 [Wenzhouxiangella sp.]